MTAANQHTLARLGLHLDDAELRAITAELDVDGECLCLASTRIRIESSRLSEAR
jgi:hypothetical protein